MNAIVRENMKAQYGKGGFKELADGYEYDAKVDKNHNFYIGSTRNAELGHQMDVAKLYDLVKNSYMQFDDAIQAQMNVVSSVEDIIRETAEAGVSTNSSIEMKLLEGIFTPAQIAEIKKSNSLMAFQGYTDKKDNYL